MVLKRVVAFPTWRGPNLRVCCAAWKQTTPTLDKWVPATEPLPATIDDCGQPLDPEAEAQIEAVLRTLWRIGRVARHNSTLAPPPPNALAGALAAGANLLMRSDIIVGRASRIAARLPAFVDLTTLIFLDRPPRPEPADRRSRGADRGRRLRGRLDD